MSKKRFSESVVVILMINLFVQASSSPMLWLHSVPPDLSAGKQSMFFEDILPHCFLKVIMVILRMNINVR